MFWLVEVGSGDGSQWSGGSLEVAAVIGNVGGGVQLGEAASVSSRYLSEMGERWFEDRANTKMHIEP
jgi:hypothetical protein